MAWLLRRPKRPQLETKSPARRRMDLDRRAWADEHALGEELSDYEVVLREVCAERWEPGPAPIDQLTGELAEPLRRPGPWFEVTPINRSVCP